MKTFVRFFFIIFTVLLLNVHSAPAENGYQTKMSDGDQKFFNGRYWNKLSDFGKTMYVTGLLDGVFFTAKQVDQETRKTFVYDVVCSLKIGEITSLMDDFYKDKFNSNLPMIIAYSLIIKKANGATQKEIDQYLSIQREYWK
jgi:hypothetical protein